jgi:hypothetical protein
MMTFVNNQGREIERIQVDGCVEGLEHQPKCDWLVKDASSNEYFVELKGTKIVYACEQLQASIDALSTNTAKRYAIVIASRVVPALTTAIQKAKATFQKKNITLIIKTSGYEHEL